jgi:hypothetical protein
MQGVTRYQINAAYLMRLLQRHYFGGGQGQVSQPPPSPVQMPNMAPPQG